MNLQEELKVLKQRIAELEEQAKQESEFPQEGDKYWYINSLGVVLRDEWLDFVSERYMIEIGNVFKTEQDAHFTVEKLKVEAELRKFSRPFKHGEDNLTLNYHHKSKVLVNVPAHSFYQEIGEFYFDNNDKVNEAREVVGEDRIKKYIFGVED